MKHLDELLSEKQHPVSQLMDWCKEDQDRAIFYCVADLVDDDEEKMLGALSEAYPDEDECSIGARLEDIIEAFLIYEMTGNAYLRYPDDSLLIDYEALYLPLEHVINDRIEVYNKS